MSEAKWLDPESGVEYTFVRKDDPVNLLPFDGVLITPCPGDTMGNEFCTSGWLWESRETPVYGAAWEWACRGFPGLKTLWDHLEDSGV